MTQLFQSLRNLYLTSRDNCASGFIVVLLTRAVNGTSLKKSFNRQMDNENMAHIHNKILFC